MTMPSGGWPTSGYNAASYRTVKDIQRVVGADPDGVYLRETSRKVAIWQATFGLEADGIWGNVSDTFGFWPLGKTPIHGVDYSFARPKPADLAARGVRLAGRYLWQERFSDGRLSKGLTRAEYDALQAVGIDVFLIYEEDGRELLDGYDAGVRVALAAEGHRMRLGLPALPIYFNVDFDATIPQMEPILYALDGTASVIGRDRLGLYGGIRPIRVAFDAQKIRWGFQTYAWSGGEWDSRAQLQQWSNRQWGGTVDFTRAVTAEFGQHG